MATWNDWIATAPDGTAIYGDVSRLETPDGRPVEAVEMTCYDYENNTQYPWYDLYYTDVYFSEEEIDKILNPPRISAEESKAVDLAPKTTAKHSIRSLAVEVYDTLKGLQHSLKSVAGSLAGNEEADTGLKFNGDNEIYYVNGINRSIAFLLQNVILRYAPKPQKKQKLGDLRDLLADLEMRIRRLHHQVPLCEQEIRKLERQLDLLNKDIDYLRLVILNASTKCNWDSETESDGDEDVDDDEDEDVDADGDEDDDDDDEDDEAVDDDEDDDEDDEAVDDKKVDVAKKQKELNSLHLNRMKLNDLIKTQQLKLKKLTSEITSTETQIEELESEIDCRLTGKKTEKKTPVDPLYILAKDALKVLNKCNGESDRFLDYLHEYADSFREKSSTDLFVEEIAATATLNFRPEKKAFVAPVDAPVVTAPVVTAFVTAEKPVDATPVAAAAAAAATATATATAAATPAKTRTPGNNDPAKAKKAPPSRADRLAAMAKAKKP